MNDAREVRLLQNAKAIIDSCINGEVSVTIGQNDFDIYSHTYDLSVILGILSNHVTDVMGILTHSNSKKGEI